MKLMTLSVLGLLLMGACDSQLELEPNAPTIIDVSMTFDEFAALADDNDLWDVPLDERGLPIEIDLPLSQRSLFLSATCSIVSALTGATASEANGGSKYASCYAYYQFPNDSESDCYIKYTGYVKRSAYKYNDVNACARTADAWYGHKLGAYYDSSSNVYLRLDRKWCAYSNCEDGFVLSY